MKCSLVGHGELVGLLFVAGCELILDAGHQVVVVRAPDGPLDYIQPPGRIQLDLEREDNRVILCVKSRLRRVV